MSDLSRLIAAVSADRETGTEDAWWRDQIGDFALVDFGTDEDVNGGQDAADRRRILRVPKIERALIETARQMRDERALLETAFAQMQQTLDRLAAQLAEARGEGWRRGIEAVAAEIRQWDDYSITGRELAIDRILTLPMPDDLGGSNG